MRKNGVLVPKTNFRTANPGNQEFTFTYCHTTGPIVTNDYLEMEISNETDTTNLLVEAFVVSGIGTVPN